MRHRALSRGICTHQCVNNASLPLRLKLYNRGLHPIANWWLSPFIGNVMVIGQQSCCYLDDRDFCIFDTLTTLRIMIFKGDPLNIHYICAMWCVATSQRVILKIIIVNNDETRLVISDLVRTVRAVMHCPCIMKKEQPMLTPSLWKISTSSLLRVSPCKSIPRLIEVVVGLPVT